MNFVSESLPTLIVLCVCICLGKGALELFYKRDRALCAADALITGELIIIGLAAAAHVGAVFTGQSFSRCTVMFLILLTAALVCCCGLLAVRRIFGRRSQKKAMGEDEGQKSEIRQKSEMKQKSGWDIGEKCLAVIFCALVLYQFIQLSGYAGAFTQGDMTVETAGSFLQTDGIYQVNPMTGQPYTAGLPLRLKILCLPTLYGILCRISGLSPYDAVSGIVSVLVFFSSYAAFYCVAESLFSDQRKNRLCFMIMSVILIWVGSYRYGADGFDLLYCGYRGVTVRNLVLIPYLISLCLRRKWKLAVLCILAEACIVWTLYGLGACVLVMAGLYPFERRKRHGGTS